MYMRMYVCTYVCMYVRMYVCMYALGGHFFVKEKTENVLRAIAVAVLGKNLLMKDVVAARKWFVCHKPQPSAQYR